MGKTVYKLSTYINKIEALYGKAREEYNKAVGELAKLEDNHDAKMKSGELNSVGTQRENERYSSKKKELLQTIAEIRGDFSDAVNDIRNSVDVLFRNNYCVNTEDVDLQGVQVLKSGMLTDKELIEMANRYKQAGNLTMYRLCGTFADSNDMNLDLRHLAVDAKRMRERTDLETINAFEDACLKGLRDDVMLANGIDNRHEEFYIDFYKAAENITAEIQTPWD